MCGKQALQVGFTLLKFVMALADQCGLSEAYMIPSLGLVCSVINIQLFG